MKDQFGNENMDRESMINSNLRGDSTFNNRAEGSITNNEIGDRDKVLAGIFSSETEVVNVINRLKEIGYRQDEITVLAKDKAKMDRIDDKTGVDTDTVAQGDHTDGDKVGSGAAIGGALGGMAAALPALGLLAIPGIGPFLAAGPIAVILGGAIAGGVAGGLIGALSELGVSEEDAKSYEAQINQGKIVVLVENRDNLSDQVNSTFNEYNNMRDNQNWRR